MQRVILASLTLILATGIAACGFKTSSVNVRGKVTFDNRPISGAEVRFTGPLGEDSIKTNLDGNYSLSVKADKNDTLQIKVLWPGFEHDEIKFKTYQAADKPTDIQLRKVFSGTTVPANSNKSANNSNK
jgi:hypothetical protein